MATVDKVFQASSPADLSLLINAFLATLVNPLILGWQIQGADVSRRIGTEMRLTLTVDDGAGPALATPFLLDLVVATGTSQLETALAAYRAAYAGQFISAAKLLFIPDENVTASLLMGVFIRNTTLAAGAANYTIAS